MRQSFNLGQAEALGGLRYLVGGPELLARMPSVPARVPFDGETLAFLNTVSKVLMAAPGAKAFPDVITLAFWLRRSSTNRLKARFAANDADIHLGRGVVFHIAPSNVPVNYAYSLASGLLTGNANVVRVPSKDFPQVDIINSALEEALRQHEDMRPYVCLVRYGRDTRINDILSGLADVRVIWGGDATIAEIRKSPLRPRAGEVTFADRFSFAVIDSDAYLALPDKRALAEGFYNDTFLTDQNACTSPRLVVWTGGQKRQAKQVFWDTLHELAEKKYGFQAIQAINKLTSSYLLAARLEGARTEPRRDNLIVRVNIPKIGPELIDLRDNSGYFFEYDCDNILDLKELCGDDRCQTVSLLGDPGLLQPLLLSGIRGIDRVAPIGKTMDFDLVWDGYNLAERLTRTVKLPVAP